jgi:diguanylate cyclase (GGDEF)-like protein
MRLSTARTAGRNAGFLFIVAGLVTVLNVVIPGSSFVNPTLVAELGVASVLVGLATLIVPWDSLPPRTTLVAVPVAFAMIAVGNRWGQGSDFVYAPYFIVTFIWIGLFQPPRTSLWLAPVAAGAYMAPLLSRPGHTNLDVASVMVVIPVGVAVGEIVSRMVAKLAGAMEQLQGTMVELDRARAESQHRADLLAEVARASRLLNNLRSHAVLRAAVDSITNLGFDCGYVCVTDGGHALEVRHTWGLAPGPDRRPSLADNDLVDRCRRQHQAQLIAEGAGASHPELQAIGACSALAGPVLIDGNVSAVFVGGKTARGRPTPEQIESFELITAQVGRALENARRYETERRTRHLMAEASVRDELTGVGNRRHATAILASLQPGDGLLLIDLDHFKDVNDTHGHIVGDGVLSELGRFLRQQLRYEDAAARYGGEEFVVVLRGVGIGAETAAERMVECWRQTCPRTTFSIGVAVHRHGEVAATTLDEADRALYLAKRSGRDRVCEWAVDQASA